jgi:hypothetical protein
MSAAACAGVLAMSGAAHAENCTTQSQMQAAEREALAAAASGLAAKVQADDEAGIRSLTISQFQANFSGIGRTIGQTAPKLKGTEPQVDQVYLLDASMLKPEANGTNPDAQFFCTLNNSANETIFSIPQLPPGKYAFTMVRMQGEKPWLLSFLLQQDGGKWLLAGVYPKPSTADGHDGLWYWKQARAMEAQKQQWDAWLYLQEAQQLVQPAGFVSSTHLESLQTELQSAVPPALSNGIGAETPLVVKAADGTEYRFTGLNVDDSVGLDVAAHLKVDSVADSAAARKRNLDAMAALLAAHPELRKAFHGVWIFAEASGSVPYATEEAMAEIP